MAVSATIPWLTFSCRMMEVWSEPEGAVTDVAMAQWEEASVVTVRANVVQEGAQIKESRPTASKEPMQSQLDHFASEGNAYSRNMLEPMPIW